MATKQQQINVTDEVIKLILAERKKSYPDEDQTELEQLLKKALVSPPVNEVNPPVKEAIKMTVEKLCSQLPKEHQKKHEEILTKIFEQGMLPKDAFGFDDKFMEFIYGHTYRLYQTGRYLEAREGFIFLMNLDPTQSKYPFALACCYQKMEKWQLAITAFFAAYAIDKENPITLYHLADCYLKLDIPQAALILLLKATSLPETRPEHLALKHRAKLMIEKLKQQLIESPPKMEQKTA